MTEPRSQPSSAVPPLIAAHDAAALALEAAAVVAAAGAIHEAVRQVAAWTHGEWVQRVGTPAAIQTGAVLQSFLNELGTRLTGIRIDPAPALLDYAERARRLGVEQGFQEAGAPARELSGRVGLDTHAAISRAVRKAQEKLAVAPRMVATVREGSLSTVTRHLAPAVQARNIVDATARTVTNTELNRGLEEVADELGARRVWIAERNACVHCLALSGRVARLGREFPMNATFAAHPLPYMPVSAGGLTGPPRHPNCRCRSSPWMGHGGPPGSIDLPTALRREAERSILDGQALPNESGRVRVQAADRLLRRISGTSPAGWRVPKSVTARARRAVERDRFSR